MKYPINVVKEYTMSNQNEKDLKEIVKQKYDEIARQEKEDCGCACGCGPEVSYTIFSEDYSGLEGYNPDADLSLGCGMPTELADIKKGDTVVDLGSGAGNDVFIARTIVGEKGRVIGIDMTESMIEKAHKNALKLGFDNVEFRLGDIDEMPLEDNIIDVAVSNCVLNLLPCKRQGFSEMYRVLKPGGHFCVSDIVTKGSLPENIREAAEMYAGCVSGAIEKEKYVNLLSEVGFSEVNIVKSRVIVLPDELLKEYLTNDEITSYRASGSALLSVTVTGNKPME
jgi:arsenite methyltransferase